MKGCKRISMIVCFCMLLLVHAIVPGQTAAAAFDPAKIADMSEFDPVKTTFPEGDTVKIGLMEAFSGPGAANGRYYWLTNSWVVYDLNKRGGISVDGKKKMVEIIKGDTQSKPAVTKKTAERLCLEDKVNVLWGASGSHICLIIQKVAEKYKVIYHNPMSLSPSLMDGTNFNRYAFRTCLDSNMFGEAMAYYFSKRPEKKFYILNQDYSYGHDMAQGFKAGLKKHNPDAVIVGEAFHPLFLKDFAPYLTKVQGAGAEVIFSGDWTPDGPNMLKQAVGMGMSLPIANLYIDSRPAMESIGGPAGRIMINANDYMVSVDTPQNNAFVKIWHESSKDWSAPYDTDEWIWPVTIFGRCVDATYWMFDVIERAGTLDPEKIIATWENDEYTGLMGKMKMRACDHQVIRDMFVTQFEFPNKWHEKGASYGKAERISSEYCTPPVPADLDRCK
ncbi:MAG: ABC transporter substrate-binding protein [Syntrophales bacterium]|nr:ABC transporter substrate-binding protein [Syntrophales bacterium]MDY0043484.1 ABC transporter substrate-binding protein [Syntrophales bacterium]